MRKKRVLVTGGAGFVGSHVAERLAPAAVLSVLDDFSRGRGDWLPTELMPSTEWTCATEPESSPPSPISAPLACCIWPPCISSRQLTARLRLRRRSTSPG